MSTIVNQQTFQLMEGIYYANSCAVKTTNGLTSLTPKHQTTTRFTNRDAGWANLGVIQSQTYLNLLNREMTLGICDNGRIWAWDTLGNFGTDLKELNYITPTPSTATFPAIYTTTKGYLMYCSTSWIGLGVPTLLVSGNTATTLNVTIDFTHADWATYPGSTCIVGAKVKILINGEVGTVASATSTTLSVSGLTLTPGNGDAVIVFIDQFAKLNTTNPAPHFVNQENIANWRREIILHDGNYLITNGNFLAQFGVVNTSLSGLANYVQDGCQLPFNYQTNCLKMNANITEIGCDFRGSGQLVLWDGSSANSFQNIFHTTTPVNSLTQYKNGWLYVSGNALRFTDGNQETIVKSYPDLEINGQWIDANNEAMTMVNNRVVVGSNGGYYMRSKSGLYVYDFTFGWTFVPIKTKLGSESYGVSVGSIFENRKNNISKVFVSYFTFTNEKGMVEYSDAAPDDWSVILWYKFDTRININNIILTLGRSHSQTASLPQSCTVTMNIGDGKEQLWQEAQALEGSTKNQIKISETNSSPAQEGDQLVVLNGNNAGFRTYVSQIDRPGDGYVYLNVAPAFPVVPTVGQSLNRLRLNFNQSKTFTTDQVASNSIFYNDTIGNSEQLFVEIVLQNASQVDILGLKIDGDECE